MRARQPEREPRVTAATPASPGPALVEEGWYRIYMPRVSVGELWRLSPDPVTAALAVILFKLLRMPGAVEAAHWLPVSLDVVDDDALPPECAHAFSSERPALEARGCLRLEPYTVRMLSAARVIGQPFFHQPSSSCVELAWTRDATGRGRLQVTAWSPLEGERCLVTTSAKRQLDDTGEADIERLVGATGEAVWGRHQERLAAQPERARVRLGFESFKAHLVGINRRTFERLARRGVMVRATDDEIAGLEARLRAPA